MFYFEKLTSIKKFMGLDKQKIGAVVYAVSIQTT